jgi:hypothetical protein
MFLLPYLEEKLGSVALWPTYVLRILFVDTPTLLGITSLAAFFYGNAAPLKAGLSLYLTCHDNDDAFAFVTCIMTEWYDELHETPDTPATVVYFNMAERQYLFVKGPVLPVLEEFSTTGFDSKVSLTSEVEHKLHLAGRCPYIPGAIYFVLQDRVRSVRRN